MEKEQDEASDGNEKGHIRRKVSTELNTREQAKESTLDRNIATRGGGATISGKT